MITLLVITLSGFHCNREWPSVPQKWKGMNAPTEGALGSKVISEWGTPPPETRANGMTIFQLDIFEFMYL
jgi:hypothetical protein